jgi:putative membrane protein
MEMHEGANCGLMMGMMGIIPISILIIIFIFLYLILRNTSRSNKLESPLEIAKKRYALGEVSKSELDQIKKDLSE